MKVLFVGNSHTYFNTLPYMVSSLAKSKGLDIDFTMLVKGGQTLDGHLRGSQLLPNIHYGNYDLVILQDAATMFLGAENYDFVVAKIKTEIDKTKAKTALYMPWASRGCDERHQLLIECAEKQAKKHSIPAAIVGLPWTRVLKEHPEIELYYDDNKHASGAGSYLAACVILKSIFGISPIGLPNTIGYIDNKTLVIPEEHAKVLQEYA